MLVLGNVHYRVSLRGAQATDELEELVGGEAPRWGARVRALQAYLAQRPDIVVVDPLAKVQQVRFRCCRPLFARVRCQPCFSHNMSGMQVLDRERLAHLLSGLPSVHVPGGCQLRPPGGFMVNPFEPHARACIY